MNTSHNEPSRVWRIILGIGLTLLGLVTISLAVFSTAVSILVLGIVLCIRGVIELITSIGIMREKGFWSHLFGGTLSLIAGAAILTRPQAIAETLTFLIGAAFIALGFIKAVSAPVEHQHNWGWIVVSGFVALLVGFWIMGAYQSITPWLIGLLLGIEFIVQGLIMIFVPYSRGAGRKRGEMFAYR